jgi:Ni,Fe-hydrogenase III small subunit
VQLQIIVQYLQLHNNTDRLRVILKGCVTHSINQNPFEIYCAIPKYCVVCGSHCGAILIQRSANTRAASNKMISVASGSSTNEKRGLNVYKSLTALWHVKSKKYSNRQEKKKKKKKKKKRMHVQFYFTHTQTDTQKQTDRTQQKIEFSPREF